MQPCVICGKILKKRESLMSEVYVCSTECKQERKRQLPKKRSVISESYWISQGLTEEEAKHQVSVLQRKRSPRSPEYYISRGYTEQEAEKKVGEYQSKLSKRNLETSTRLERQLRSRFSTKYWEAQGYSKEEAAAITRKNSQTVSLDTFIEKYGETQGKQKYSEMCEYRRENYTLEGYQKRYGQIKGEQLWSKKFKNRHNSKKANRFFEELLSSIDTKKHKVYTASNNNGEYGVLDKEENKYYFYDFVIPELKLCVEFNGDYWHCNPKKYSPLYEHKQSGLLASDIWEHDRRKREVLQRERDFSIIVVWESDNLDEKLNLIKEKIYEFGKSQDTQ